ncbi:hypothetical protein D9611_011823 [Ephemerocybe angulata]|uniref:Extracellular metalloproteinase n=1 Tax=Ephemerocybe angulata TaxID=980116 RepID=A0A8H5BXK3_9AGAR|nr:hypothetical protein D9611_011823 [Tulosesus angulatus]
MAGLRKLLASVILAVLLISETNAIPSSAPYSHATHHRRKVGRRGLELEHYNPPSTFETFGEGLVQAATFAPGGLDTEARTYAATKLKVDYNTVEFRSGFTRDKARHAYVRQQINGIPVANAVANVAYKDNKVVSFGSSFVKPNKIADPKPTVELTDVLSKIEEQLEGKYNNQPISLQYLARPDGSVALVHAVQIQNEQVNSWYEAFVDAHSGALLSATDFTAEASYRVLPIQNADLRGDLELLVDPHDPIASPNGWHLLRGVATTTTSGNNAIALKASQTNLTSQSADGLIFDYPYDKSQEPDTTINIDAARTNAFYIANRVHDLAYRYGFTESAFNYQVEGDFSKGGKGGDRVFISVQDGTGVNNANFAVGPDGLSGTARMYIWDWTTPKRDGSLDNGILVHELTHGITSRLTGGGTASCLQSLESRALGEGWSDAFAEWTEQKDGVVRDHVLGDYVLNNPAGIRSKPYSVNKDVNPLTYADAASRFGEHAIGEIWANTLHNIYAKLVEKYGWSSTAMTNPDGSEGNILYLHIFIDALSLQPCNPTFVQARDAWIQADFNRYGGANKCLLWKVFADKGLGVQAVNYVNDFSVPNDCA